MTNIIDDFDFDLTFDYTDDYYSKENTETLIQSTNGWLDDFGWI